MPSFLSVIETIGKDIVKGVETAAKIPGVSAVPMAGPIIVEVGTLLSTLESKGSAAPTAEQISEIVQILAAAQAVKQTAAPTSAN